MLFRRGTYIEIAMERTSTEAEARRTHRKILLQSLVPPFLRHRFFEGF
jgi:hypothetical protein